MKIDSCTKYRKSDKGRNTKLLRDFGITLKDYREMLSNQNGRCKICLSIPRKRNLAVDHCHKTGIVRGLLCMSCNKGLGHFHDIPEILERAILYLKESYVINRSK